MFENMTYLFHEFHHFFKRLKGFIIKQKTFASRKRDENDYICISDSANLLPIQSSFESNKKITLKVKLSRNPQTLSKDKLRHLEKTVEPLV